MRRYFTTARVVLLVGLTMTVIFVFVSQSRPEITISPETTYITEPLAEDGQPDYMAALNERYTKNINPENNAAVLFWKALGPEAIIPEDRDRYFTLLGIDPLPEKGDYFKSPGQFLKCQSDRQGASSHNDRFRKIEEELEAARRRPWSAEKYPRLVKWIEANAEPLKTVLEGTQASKCYTPLISDGETVSSAGLLESVSVPMTQKAVDLARALAARAMLRLKTGHIDRVWKDIIACYRLSRLIGQGPFLVQQFVALRINGYACEATQTLAHYGRLSADQAEQCRRDLAQLRPLPDTATKVGTAERFSFLDTVIRVILRGRPLLDDNGFWNSIQSALKQRRIATSFEWNEVLQAGNEYFDRLVAALKKPGFRQRQKAIQSIYERAMRFRKKYPSRLQGRFATISGSNAEAVFLLLKIAESEADLQTRTRIAAHVLAAVLMPAVSRANEAATRAKVEMAQTRLALALAAYRAQHGTYPNTLAPLVPEHLDRIPHDKFTGEAFRYQRRGEHYQLHSSGPNRQDDEGNKDDVRLAW